LSFQFGVDLGFVGYHEHLLDRCHYITDSSYLKIHGIFQHIGHVYSLVLLLLLTHQIAQHSAIYRHADLCKTPARISETNVRARGDLFRITSIKCYQYQGSVLTSITSVDIDFDYIISS
uniref:Secreted protein n=1 Tax=Haemonchus placei TaxID=6290 RepID=A0A0N4WY05_HAEPC